LIDGLIILFSHEPQQFDTNELEFLGETLRFTIACLGSEPKYLDQERKSLLKKIEFWLSRENEPDDKTSLFEWYLSSN